MTCGEDCALYRQGGRCSGSHDGLAGYFDECDDKKCFKPKEANMEKKKEVVATKVCYRCGRELPLDDFPPSDKARDGHLNVCKECNYQARSAAMKKVAARTRGESTLAGVPDDVLAAELRRRGWSGSLEKKGVLEV